MTTDFAAPPVPKPILSGRRSQPEQLTITVFLLVPFLALIAAVPLMWGWGLSWTDLWTACGLCPAPSRGVPVGYHRYFTPAASKPTPRLLPALPAPGSPSAQGSVTD